jgi:DNA-binding response OmpR family regulator
LDVIGDISTSCHCLYYMHRLLRGTDKIPALTSSKRLSSSPAHRSFESAPRSLRIIVADDERDTVLTLSMILRDEGHDVQGVHKGSRVLPLLREVDPDVVLLDIALPEKNGYEIAEEIRKHPRGQRVLLIGISGRYKQASDKVLADLKGFDHYLVKPFDPAALLALLAPLTWPNAGR